MKNFSIKKILMICAFAMFTFLISGCEMHIHQMGEWQTESAANCTQAEVLKRECSCGFKETKFGKNALGHKYKETVIKPTETQSGYTNFKCDCGDAYVDKYTYLITFHSITENPELQSEDLPQIKQRVYSQNEVFYGFTNTSTIKVVAYKVFENEQFENFEVGKPFTKSAEIFIVWDKVSSPQNPVVPEHQHSYQTSVVNPTKTAKGYTLHSCLCGDSYKTDYTYLISFKSIIEQDASVALPQIANQTYTQDQSKFAGISNYYYDDVFAIKEYRVNGQKITANNYSFSNSTEVTIVWELVNLEPATPPVQSNYQTILSVVEEVERLSIAFGDEQSSNVDAQLRTMQYFRTIKYGTTSNEQISGAWNLICGTIEPDFANYVETNINPNLKLSLQQIKNGTLENLINPNTNEEVDFIHMMGVMNAIKTNYFIPYLITEGQASEITGWAGDICDLVKQLKNYTGEQLITKANELFNGGLDSSFSRFDLAADIDAVLIMNYFNNSSTLPSISNAMRSYYEHVQPELEQQNEKLSMFTRLILGEVDDGSALKNAVKNKVQNNIFITGIPSVVEGLNETYGISFENNAEQFNIVYELFAKFLLGINK